MSSVIQAPHGVTYNGEEAKEYIWIPAITYGGMEDFFKVLTGVKTKQQVLYMQYFDKITHIDTGCDSAAVNKQILRTEQFWDPQPVEALLSQCYTDLYGSSFEKLLKGGTDKYKLEGTEIEKLMLEAMVYAGDTDLKRMIWLGNKSIIAANLTNGATDVGNYNQVNGVWQRLKAGVVAGTIPRYTITQNAATTTAGQSFTADADSGVFWAPTILRAVYRNQKPVLRKMNKKAKKFYVDQATYDNYSESLAFNKTLESARMQLLNGTDTLSFEGIPLEINDVVDTYLASDFTFGSGANQTITDPHRVLLTVKDNLQFSVDTETSYPVAFETWTEKKEKRWYGRALYELDVQIARPELCSVAY